MRMDSVSFVFLAFFIQYTIADGIIGGKEVIPHSRPYMAFLNITRPKKQVRCGGILISENFVLTAAHCNGTKIVVTLGAHNIDEREKEQQKIDVCEQIQHPSYEKDKSKDIMLLKLRNNKAVPNQNVLPIRLSQSGPKPKTGDLCNVAGWGRNNTFNERMNSKLQELDMEVVAPDECTKAFPDDCHNMTELICAQNFSKPRKCSSLGDSGGPLFCGKYLHGLVQGGRKNCTGPRFFTNVFSYIPWINRHLKKPKCKKESY